jgi:membrane protein
MGRPSWRRLVGETIRACREDRVFRMAAALAYYSIVSLAPLVLSATGIAGLVFGEEAVRGELQDRLKGVVGSKPAAAIEELLGGIYSAGGNSLFTVLGFAGLLLGASWVFSELQDSLDTIWKVPPHQGMGFLAQVRNRLFSFALVFVTGVLLTAVLAAGVAAVAFTNLLGPSYELAMLSHGVNFLFSYLLIGLFFALLYKLLPSARVRWRDVWVGAASSALFYLVGNYALSFYLAYSFLRSAFGAAGAVFIILIWVYYSSLAFLFGAEFTYALGSRRCRERSGAAGAP